jgi:hypothetical protein
MAKQLIYTSAPRGLVPGQSGFCTVARHRSLGERLVAALERISSYAHSVAATSGGASLNPVIAAHRILDVGGTRYHVLSRLRDAGSDYTRRSNHIAHHLICEENEIARAPSPARVLRAWQGLPRWDQPPRYLDQVQDAIDLRELAKRTPSSAATWQQLASNADCAALLVDDRALQGCHVVTPSGNEESLLALFEESLSRLDPSGANTHLLWQVTFTTFLQRTDNPGDFAWRGCQKRPSASGAPVFDLNQPQELAAQIARLRPTSRYRPPTTEAAVAAPTASAAPTAASTVSSQRETPPLALARPAAAPPQRPVSNKSFIAVAAGSFAAVSVLAVAGLWWLLRPAPPRIETRPEVPPATNTQTALVPPPVTAQLPPSPSTPLAPSNTVVVPPQVASKRPPREPDTRKPPGRSAGKRPSAKPPVPPPAAPLPQAAGPVATEGLPAEKTYIFAAATRVPLSPECSQILEETDLKLLGFWPPWRRGKELWEVRLLPNPMSDSFQTVVFYDEENSLLFKAQGQPPTLIRERAKTPRKYQECHWLLRTAKCQLLIMNMGSFANQPVFALNKALVQKSGGVFSIVPECASELKRRLALPVGGQIVLARWSDGGWMASTSDWREVSSPPPYDELVSNPTLSSPAPVLPPGALRAKSSLLPRELQTLQDSVKRLLPRLAQPSDPDADLLAFEQYCNRRGGGSLWQGPEAVQQYRKYFQAVCLRFVDDELGLRGDSQEAAKRIITAAFEAGSPLDWIMVAPDKVSDAARPSTDMQAKSSDQQQRQRQAWEATARFRQIWTSIFSRPCQIWFKEQLNPKPPSASTVSAELFPQTNNASLPIQAGPSGAVVCLLWKPNALSPSVPLVGFIGEPP